MTLNAFLIWQGFQIVVQTMVWEVAEKGLSDGELAEIEIEIQQIRELLDEDTNIFKLRKL